MLRGGAYRCGIVVVLLCSACIRRSPSTMEAAPESLKATGELPPELHELQERGLSITGERVEFEGELEFPPKLKGRVAASDVRPEIQPGPHPSMQEARRSMRTAAVGNPRVQALLGERFSLLASGWLENDKDRSAGTADRYQMTFYNYASDHVVTVLASSAGEVIDASAEPVRVQPAESHEEVEAAAEIVRKDPHYGNSIAGLRARGIQTEGAGTHRYLYLLFYREPRTPAVFEATVDMSAVRVVAARATATSHSGGRP